MMAWLSLTMVAVGSARVYWFNPRHKAQYKGLGNQLWERSSASALYRMAEGFLVHDMNPNVTIVLGNILGHAKYPFSAPSESCMFDLSSTDALTTWEEVAQRGLQILAPRCEDALDQCKVKQLIDSAHSNASHFVVSYPDRDPVYVNHCSSATAEEACGRSDDFVWVGNVLPCVGINKYPSAEKPQDPDFLNPMASPYFFDPTKHRYCGGGRGCAARAAFNPESGLAASSVSLHRVLALDFAPTVLRVATAIMADVLGVAAADGINAVHVRRGDRLKPIWQAKLLYLAGPNCTTCDTCMYHCAPSNEDIRAVYRNFSRPEFPVWVATDDDSTAFLFRQRERRFFGLKAPGVADLLQRDAALADLPSRHHRLCIEEGIDIFFLTYARSAIFDVASTFSAIAYRKREALGLKFQMW